MNNFDSFIFIICAIIVYFLLHKPKRELNPEKHPFDHPSGKLIKKIFLIGLLSIIILGYSGVLMAQYYKRAKIPKAAWECLANPKEMVLFSVNPEPKLTPRDNEVFLHGFKVIGSVSIENKEKQDIIEYEVKCLASTLFVVGSACFNPRHLVRVSNGKVTFDFLICYECSYMEVYFEEEKVAFIKISGSPSIFNNLLTNTKVALQEPQK